LHSEQKCTSTRSNNNKKKKHKEKEFLSVREKCIEMRAITTSPGSERR
jgi:hypothetical protein